MSFEEDVKVRDAFEAEHKCKIIREFTKVPPVDFQELMVKEANTYYVLSKARFIGKALVADRFGGHGAGSESLYSMLDGLERGYKLALGPTKPYSLTYVDVQYTPRLKRFYVGKTEKEVYEAEGLDYYSDKLPENLFKKKQITEWFATDAEADARIKELRHASNDTTFPVPTSTDDWLTKYDHSKSSHF